MAWNITGEVESGGVDAKEDLCVREDVNQYILKSMFLLYQYFQIRNVPGEVQCSQSRVVQVHGHLSQV